MQPAHPTDERSVDIMILQDSLNSLFTSSLLFDEQSLAELICALAQLTVTKLQDTSNSDYLQDFGLKKLIETSLVNVSRIDIFWKSIVAHFDMLAGSKDPRVRQYTVEAMHILVLEIFAYKKQFFSPALDDDFPDDSIANEDEIVC